MSIRSILLIFFGFIISCFGQDSIWTKIDDGLFYIEIHAIHESNIGNNNITVIRINPDLYSLILLSASELKVNGLTVKKWVENYNLIGAINAGMYQSDYKSNVGYMKNYSYINNSKLYEKYFSITAFNPIDSTASPFRIFDSDETDIKQIEKSYNTIIQNLRLIKHPGLNKWSKQNRRWSEAALGQDKFGNILFIFSRSPYSMYEFNQSLLSSPIHIECAQHLEGGPEASLYLNYRGIEIKKAGSYETDFNENDDNNEYWPIPNVIGVIKKLK